MSEKNDYQQCLNSNYDHTASKGDDKKATCVEELKQLAKTKTDFAEADIKERTTTILEAFAKFLDEQGLIK